ncbi:MAG: ATP-binding protein [Pseudomonadota bacterium]
MDVNPDFAREPETVGELRALYRAAEARAARLRLLIEAGRDLTSADGATLEAALALAARRAALFAGHADAAVALDPAAEGLPLMAPGAPPRKVGALQFAASGKASPPDAEDAEALNMLGQLMAAAIDRTQREQERDRLLDLLRERERRLEAVVGRLFAAQEEERRRVSRELHDGVAQSAGALFRQIEAQKGASPTPETLGRLAELAQGLVRELRAAIADLRPTALDDLGLAAAIGALAESLARDGYGVEITTTGPARWPPVLETAFFRVAQEAMSNIRKHAGGLCKVEIALAGAADGDRWRLRIRDWGRGLPSERPAQQGHGEHVGLEVMSERMAAIGGRLSISSAPGGGVEVVAVLEQMR